MKYKRPSRPSLPFSWPKPPFHIALVEPEIPPNTGNIARLCAGTGTALHLVGKLGFEITDSALRRAGLDYWDSVRMTIHKNFQALDRHLPGARFFFFSTQASKSYTDAQYLPGDVLVFGCESRGLPDDILKSNRNNVLGIPIRTEHIRSLNLATAVGIVLYEALRQTNKPINLSLTPIPPD